ncbi:hypothetical protein MFUR16E_21555 [Methylobacterium fujisawaense]|uniref:hypothetical protein n=1 Tax=Methylobacterium fujisawaense TaxID=107400 RepID=UPI002F2F4B20
MTDVELEFATVDDVKEALALFGDGLITLGEACAQQGRSWMDVKLQIEAEKAFFASLGVAYPVAVHGDAGTAAGGRLTDAYGNRFFEVGDLVTRDGTDIHRVVSHNGSPGHAPDGFTVVCVKAPAGGWTEVGEEEFNVCRRYEWVDDVIEGKAS